MIYVGDLCDNCKHKRGIEKHHVICDAFPEGLPFSVQIFGDREKECNNGLKYEPIENEKKKN